MKLSSTTATLAFALAAWLASVGTSVAQDAWVGRATIGDVARHQLGQALLAQQEAVRSKAQFGAENEKARQEFRATAAKPQDRAAAEQQFATLLLG